MKTSRIFYLTLSFVSLIVLSACSDDPEEVVSPLVGDYLITKAELTVPITLETIEKVTIPIPAGYDITLMIQEALLGEIECTPEKSLIELREDYALFLGCLDSDSELNAGTWEEVSETVINLNLNSTAVPSSPTGIVLTVSDVAVAGDMLSGVTTVPLPSDMLAAIVFALSGGQLTLDLEKTGDVVTATFKIVLTKQ